MIEMSMSDQHRIDGRKIPHAQPRTTQPLQNENPPGKVRVNENILATDLQKEAGVPNECNAELFPRNQDRLSTCAATGGHCRAPHQRTELPGFAFDTDAYHEVSVY